VDIRELLRQLQEAVRSDSGPDEQGSRGSAVPADLQADIHYEHLGDEADKAVWSLVCHAAIEVDRNHMPGFVAAHRQEPILMKILYGIEYPTAGESFNMHDVVMMPLPDEST
jgi:hypothetical protein